MANEPTLTLDTEQVASIRKALIIGLTSYGAIEEALNTIELRRMRGDSVPDGLAPAHPTGTVDVASTFATAFGLLEFADGSV